MTVCSIKYVAIAMIIIVLCMYSYRKTETINNEIVAENFYSRKWWHPKKPPNEPNTAFVVMRADDRLWIYHDKGAKAKDILNKKWKKMKYIGYIGRAWQWKKFVVKNFTEGDRLVFYYRNYYGSGHMAGHIYWNKRFYPTNNINFECTNVSTYAGYRPVGRRIGCFWDGRNRRLPYYGGWRKTHEECRDIALKRNHTYYGLQRGGTCRTGTSLARAKGYGKTSEWRCNWRNFKNWRTRGTQKGGGWWTNDLYTTRKPPKIRDCGRAWGWYMHPNARKIKTEIGPYCSSNELRTVEIEWFPKFPKIQKFCPHPGFSEFKPAACNDPRDWYRCWKSAYPNFKPDWAECRNWHNVTDNNYDNKNFFSIVYEAWEFGAKKKGKDKYKWHGWWTNKLKEQMNSLVKTACELQGNDDTYFDVKKCINVAKEKLNKPEFYRLISKAMGICEKKDPQNEFLCNSFKKNMNELIKYSRILRGYYNSKNYNCECMKFTKKGPKCVPC